MADQNDDNKKNLWDLEEQAADELKAIVKDKDKNKSK